MSVIFLQIGLAACGGQQEMILKKENNTVDGTEQKKSVMKFYLLLVQTINRADASLNDFELTESAPTLEMKVKASESSAIVAEELSKLEIPELLKNHDSNLEAIIQQLIASYEAKAEELRKDEPSLEQANQLFQEANEALGNLFERVGLNRASIDTEVNS